MLSSQLLWVSGTWNPQKLATRYAERAGRAGRGVPRSDKLGLGVHLDRVG